MRGGPTPITKGQHAITDEGVVGKVVHVGMRAPTIKVHNQGHELMKAAPHPHAPTQHTC